MSSFYAFLINEIVIVPALIGFVRYKKIDKTFRPFIFLLFAGALSECAGYFFFMRLHVTNAPQSKIYSLIECIIILVLFHAWGFLKQRKFWFYLLLSICIIFWFIESIIFLGIKDFTPFFRIFYSFIIVLISINQINYVIIRNTTRNLFKNAKFLICIGFVIFFIYQILYEAAYYVSVNTKNDYMVTSDVISLFSYINTFVNLIYFVAVFFIPQREDFYFGKDSNFSTQLPNE